MLLKHFGIEVVRGHGVEKCGHRWLPRECRARGIRYAMRSFLEQSGHIEGLQYLLSFGVERTPSQPRAGAHRPAVSSTAGRAARITGKGRCPASTRDDGGIPCRAGRSGRNCPAMDRMHNSTTHRHNKFRDDGSAVDVDTVIRHLPLTSFRRSIGARIAPSIIRNPRPGNVNRLTKYSTARHPPEIYAHRTTEQTARQRFSKTAATPRHIVGRSGAEVTEHSEPPARPAWDRAGPSGSTAALDAKPCARAQVPSVLADHGGTFCGCPR